MAVSANYALEFVKLLDFASVDSAADVTPLFNGGFAGIGDRAGAFSNSRGTLFDALGAQTGTVTGFSGFNGAVDQLSNGNLVIAGEDGDSIVFKIVSSVTGATVVSTVDLGLLGGTNADVEAISSDRFCIVNQRGSGIDVEIRNNNGSYISSLSITGGSGVTVSRPSVCGSNDGSAIVAWQQTEASSQKYIWYKLIGSDGSQGNSTLFLGTNSVSIDRNIETVAIRGGFALLYEDWAVSGVAGPTVIRMARFTDAGAFVGTTTVSGTSAVNATHPSATILPNGLLAVTYTQELSSDSDTIVSLVDPGTGSALAFREVYGGEFPLDDVDNPVIAAFGLGQLAVFHTNGTDGDADGEALQAVRTTVSDSAGDLMGGDDLVDVMYGGAGDDTLFGFANNDLLDCGSGSDLAFGGDGNDALIGGSGVDEMTGGQGDDRLYVDNPLDTVTEAAGAGSGLDFIFASVSFTNAANVERLYLTGSANINGTGRDGQVDVIYGNSGNNVLDGKTGSDKLNGGAGNDSYHVNTSGDVVAEAAGAGFDTIFSQSSYTINTNVERLFLLDGGNYNANGRNGQNDFLAGNSGANVINGFSGNDTIRGGLGNDTLTGGTGLDIFQLLTTPHTATNRDTITDFSAADDTIQLDNLVYPLLAAPGALAANLFKNLTLGAQDADDVVLYNDASGAIYYDTNGLMVGGVIQFATIVGAPTLTNADFVVV